MCSDMVADTVPEIPERTETWSAAEAACVRWRMGATDAGGGVTRTAMLSVGGGGRDGGWAQAELRERAEDVRYRLWEMSDASREAAEVCVS